MTVRAIDIADYIITQTGEITAMRLQNLLYYAQAWHLVWNGEPLFDDVIEARWYGPIVPTVYQQHVNQFTITRANFPTGDQNRMSPAEQENVRNVINTYGHLTAQTLSECTRQDAPWRNTYYRDVGHPNVIQHEDLIAYYTERNMPDTKHASCNRT